MTDRQTLAQARSLITTSARVGCRGYSAGELEALRRLESCIRAGLTPALADVWVVRLARDRAIR